MKKNNKLTLYLLCDIDYLRLKYVDLIFLLIEDVLFYSQMKIKDVIKKLFFMD